MHINREKFLGFNLNLYTFSNQSLEKIEKMIWDYLIQGVKNKKSAFNCPTLITQGEEINPRTLILREVEKKKFLITFFTDKRTNKKIDIDNNNNSVVHVYDKRRKQQVCLYGKAKIENKNSITKNYWKKLNNFSKLNYAYEKAPGSEILMPNHVNYMKNDNQMYENFSVINIKIYKIIWLLLSKEGNKKAEFKYNNSNYNSKWLVP